MELKEAIDKLKEMQESVRYKTIIENEERDEWKKEVQAIETVLEELNNRIPIKKIKKVLEELDERAIYSDKCNYYARLTVSEALFLKHFIENEILNKE